MSTVIGAVKVEEGFTLAFRPNPKRPNFNAHRRYEKYQAATTLEEYFDIAESKYAKADLRYDMNAGYITVFNADGEQINNIVEETEETEAEAED